MPIDFEVRVIERLDKTCNDIGCIKTDIAVLKERLNAHLDDQEKKETRKMSKQTLGTTVIGLFFAGYVIFKEWLN